MASSGSLHPSATSKLLSLRMAVLQRECLKAVFCSLTPPEDASCAYEELDAWEADSFLSSLRLSVGLPDVAPCSFARVESHDSPLRDRLPSREVLKAEAYLAACSFAEDSAYLDGREAFEQALWQTLQWAASASQRDSLWSASSQRLPAVLYRLLRQADPRTLHRQAFHRRLCCDQQLSLRPAGELLLALVDICLDVQSEAVRQAAQEKANWKKRRDNSSPLGLLGKKDGEAAGQRDSLLHHLQQTLHADLLVNDLQQLVLRLRAESDALAALQGISLLKPVAALVALEQLMQQPRLQHLAQFEDPPVEVLSGVFYETLLRCFAFATALSNADQPVALGLRLTNACKGALRRCGLRDACCRELLATAHTVCTAETGCLCSTGEATTDDSLTEHASHQQLLLPPPDSCAATARAFCCFLCPEARPPSPWLPQGSEPTHAADLSGPATSPPGADSERGGKAGLGWNQTSGYEYAACSLKVSEAHKCEERTDRGDSLAAQLRAFDESLRPTASAHRRKQKLHRLLVKWLKVTSALPDWRSCGRSAEEVSSCREQNAPCTRQANSLLSPLLLPYGSSVTGFGSCDSDLDLCLLLPFPESCFCCCKGDQAGATQLDETASQPQAASSRFSSDCEAAKASGNNGHPTCCCSCCARASSGSSSNVWMHEADKGIKILKSLKDGLSAEPQLQKMLTNLEVVIPASAPPVLRGVYLQQRIRRRSRRQQSLSRLAEIEESSRRIQSQPFPSGSDCSAHSRQAEGDSSFNSGSDSCVQASAVREQSPAGQLNDPYAGSLGGHALESRGNENAGAQRESLCKADKRREASLYDEAASDGKGSAGGSQAFDKLSSNRHLNSHSSSSRSCSSTESADEELREGCIPVAFEVTVGSVLGPLNSLLLRAYAQRCPLLLPLVRIIRHWAECRGLTGTRDGNLSSYAWSLLVLFFAQSTSPALTANLQAPFLKISSRGALPQATSRLQQAAVRSSLSLHVPAEYVCGCHGVWFLNSESEYPLGSRVADLLRPVFRGCTEDLLLQLVQRYVPGHALLLPMREQQHPGDDQSAESPEEASFSDSFDVVKSKEGGNFKMRKKLKKWRPWNTLLGKHVWKELASLFHAFFTFYGYHFNSCAHLVSPGSPSLRCKQGLRACCAPARRDDGLSRSTEASVADRGFPVCPHSSSDKLKGQGIAFKSQPSKLECFCLSCNGRSKQGFVTSEKRQIGELKITQKDTEGAQGGSRLTGHAGSNRQSQAREWRLIFGGREADCSRDVLLSWLQRQIDGIVGGTPSACGADIEDPMETGRLLRFRKPEGDGSCHEAFDSANIQCTNQHANMLTHSVYSSL
ncbi:hypothetical protein Efla_006336 [Eimeria flavescens]